MSCTVYKVFATCGRDLKWRLVPSVEESLNKFWADELSRLAKQAPLERQSHQRFHQLPDLGSVLQVVRPVKKL